MEPLRVREERVEAKPEERVLLEALMPPTPPLTPPAPPPLPLIQLPLALLHAWCEAVCGVCICGECAECAECECAECECE
jgi:hypothetical protein